VTQPLVSGSWYRVAPLRPSLVAGLKIVRQRVRDQLWHVLVEPGSGRQLRLNPAAYAFAGRCDGRASVEQLWQAALRREGEDAPTQDDVLRLLAQLFRAGMLHFDAAPHLSMLFARRGEDDEKRRRSFVNPLALRLRLFDPTRLLDRLLPQAARVPVKLAAAVWLLLVLLAAVAAAVSFPQLKADALRVMATPSSYAMAWLAYPLVKSLHELAHALAVRRFGGAVREVGLSMLMLTPAPYVDASAANAFPSARERALVSAAGILVELALAALALFAWTVLSPGLLRDAATVVVLICSVSTFLFNANPLMRMDGYYLLCDALQLPNLALRSHAWWASAWRRALGAEPPLPASALAAGESKWLLAYAPASFAYRIALLCALVGWVGHHSWLAGWGLALGLLAWLATLAVRAVLRSAAAAPQPAARRKVLAIAAGAAAAVLLAVFVVPLPASVVTQGVVWPPDHAQLRPDAAGFVEQPLVRDGDAVQQGQVVLRLADAELVAQRDKAISERTGLMAEQYHALLLDPARAGDVNEQLARNDAELQHAEGQLAGLEVRARSTGRAVLPHEQDMDGTFVQRGAMVGYVLGPEPAQVRAVLRDEDLLRVRGRVRAVEVRLADSPWTARAAQLRSETPAATRQLPSAALGDRQGGPVAVEPADKDGLRTQAPVFLVDVVVPDLPAGHVGGRAWVKLQLPSEPLGWQAVRNLRQLLLRQFSPTGQA
jgi:putative peptide zinc metalloprotease protein